MYKQVHLSYASFCHRCSASTGGNLLHPWRLTARARVVVRNRLASEDAKILFRELSLEVCPVVRVELEDFGPNAGGIGWRCASTFSPAAPELLLPGSVAPVKAPPPRGMPCGQVPGAASLPDSMAHPRSEAAPNARSHLGRRTQDGSCSSGVLISVPLRLCLSHEVPGCCPPLLRSPTLKPLLQCCEEAASWEVKLAALLLCATSGYDGSDQSMNSNSSSGGGISPMGQQGSASGDASGMAVGSTGRCCGSGSCVCCSTGGEAAAVRSFWRRYRGLLPPARQQCSLLFASEAELQLLQDPPLAAEAATWQQHVLRAYDTWVDTPAFRAAVWGPDGCRMPDGDPHTPHAARQPGSGVQDQGPTADDHISKQPSPHAETPVEASTLGLRDTFRAEGGDGVEVGLSPPEVRLGAWLAAVGAVESRAFGFRGPDGAELRAYVPFLCCANYQPGAHTTHVLRLEPPEEEQARKGGQEQQAAGGTAQGGGSSVEYREANIGAVGTGPQQQLVEGGSRRAVGGGGGGWEPTCDMVGTRPLDAIMAGQLPAGGQGAHGVGVQVGPGSGGHGGAAAAVAPGGGGEDEGQQQGQRLRQQRQQQLFIDYGRKNNRQLVFQYGFVLPGNPYDRLDWEGLDEHQDPSHRMRREWVYGAVCGVAERLVGAHPMWKHGPGGPEAVRARLQSAAASIVGRCGWRNLRERRGVTVATELACITAMEAWVSRQLESFSTTAHEDWQLSDMMKRGGAQLWSRAGRERRGDESGDEGAVAGQCGGHRSPGRLAGAVGQNADRAAVAISYRLERKLLLLSAEELLRCLRMELEHGASYQVVGES